MPEFVGLMVLAQALFRHPGGRRSGVRNRPHTGGVVPPVRKRRDPRCGARERRRI